MSSWAGATVRLTKQHGAQQLPSLIGSGLSLASCLWFLFRCLPRVHKKYSQTLLMRQLRHLAIADSFMAIMSFVNAVPQLVSLPSADVCNVWEYGVWALYLWPMAMSVVVETQVAVSFLSVVRRWPRMLQCVACSLPFMWLLALAIAILDILGSALGRAAGAVNLSQTGECTWQGGWGVSIHESAPVLFGFMVALTIMNAASYVALVAVSRCIRWQNVPAGSVADKARQQGLRYLVVAVVTWAPHCLVLATGNTPAYTWVRTWPQAFTATAMSLNGALNCWAYASHSRHVKHMYKTTTTAGVPGEVESKGKQAGDARSHSCHVTFATDVVLLSHGDEDSKQAPAQEELAVQWMWHSPEHDLSHPAASPF